MERKRTKCFSVGKKPTVHATLAGVAYYRIDPREGVELSRSKL